MYTNFVEDKTSIQLFGCSEHSPTLYITLTSIRGLLFTDSMIVPVPAQHVSQELPENFPSIETTNGLPLSPMNVLTREQEHALWHFRLGHHHERLISDLHKYVDGVPGLP